MFKQAAWLGWEMDSNWTEPGLFLIYSIIKPVAGAFILVLMSFVALFIGTGNPDLGKSAMFAYLFVGNAFFIYVASVLFGCFQVIQSDREWYQTIRYVYMSPINFYTYIVGRAASKVLLATIATAVTLAFGVFALHIDLSMSLWDIPLFLAVMVIGLLCVVAIGLCLAGLSFLTAKHTHGLAEGIPGMFYLFCGVIFPLSVLPGWGQSVGRALPITYWLEAIRRLILPSSQIAQVTTGLEQTDLAGIIALLLISTAFFFLLSILLFRMTEYLARKAGIIDMTTNY